MQLIKAIRHGYLDPGKFPGCGGGHKVPGFNLKEEFLLKTLKISYAEIFM